MNLFEIRDKAIKSQRAVFTITQLSHLIGKPKNITRVYFNRLVNKKLAIRLARGKISFSDDEFVIAGQLIEPSYISLFSALNLNQTIQQMPRAVFCVCTKNTIKFTELGIEYHKISPKLFYGFKRVKRGSSHSLVADSEKALIDLVYLNLIGKSSARELAGELDKEKLKEYIYRFSGNGRVKLEKWLL